MPDKKPVKCSFTVHPTCMSIVYTFFLSICMPDNKPVKCSLSTLPACSPFCLSICKHNNKSAKCSLSTLPAWAFLSACIVYARLTTNLSNINCPPYLHVYSFCLTICTADQKPFKCSLSTLPAFLFFLLVYMHA